MFLSFFYFDNYGFPPLKVSRGESSACLITVSMCGFFPLEFECVESQIFEQSYNHFNYADFGAGQPDYRMSRSVVQIDPVS